MRLLSYTNLTTREEPDSLTFCTHRERGWFERGVVVAIVFICFGEAHQWHSLIWLAFGLIAAIGTISDCLQGAAAELTVTSSQMVARGNVGRTFSTKVLLQSAEVVSLRYDIGQEGDPSGLYAKQAWQNTCILANISREQSNQVANEIYRKFPEIAKGEDGSLLFGTRNESITLGLSQPK